MSALLYANSTIWQIEDIALRDKTFAEVAKITANFSFSYEEEDDEDQK
ncbi:MAG: hypothetical protein FWC47_06520 [Oscillospiraceae bacterium]|nr:hypothetical protein [Oscillospiraceae bacterium]